MAEKIERMELEAESKDKVYFIINYTTIFVMSIDYLAIKAWTGHICVAIDGASRTLQFSATFDCWIKY